VFHLVLTAVLLPGLAVPALFPFTVLAVAVIGCLFAAAETVRCFPLPAEPRPWYVTSRRRLGVLSLIQIGTISLSIASIVLSPGRRSHM
jgi:hypothetical protein